MKKTVTRLFESIQPTNYNLILDLDPGKKLFSGSVTIKAKKTGRPSQRITLHQKDLKITGAEITRHDKRGDEVMPVDRVNSHSKYDELRLHSSKKLFPGDYTITVHFEGKITDQMSGLYPCYFTHKGKEKLLLATQFESHHAREVFPCVDEPEAKATFDLTLTTPKVGTVLGNTPILTQEANGKRLETRFETTPIMSTYLLAFVTGEMHSIEAKTKDGVVVRSWSSVAQPKSTLQYSVDEGVKILEFFSEYFQTPYPLPKCDQVALPDFDAGAMENWGLITYREIALLADANNRSVSNEQYVSMVVAHELSHQWFGNLVTMKWWDDLWLNESFASIMEHIALAAIHPDWQQWEHYVASDVLSTSNRDIYSDIQPVTVEVIDPELIETLFDPGIVYAKGGRLLKMLIDYIGEGAFRKGLKDYFKAHAYQNATRNDLWKALGAASKYDIGSLMDEWLTKPGMPVVSVTQKSKTLELSQERYLLDNKSDTSLWPVPLLADQNVKPNLFETREATVLLDSDANVILNQHGSGHYFVHYQDKAHREYLNKNITSLKIPTESRINILNDMFMLARRGDASLTDALDAVVSSGKEPRDTVWVMIGRILASASQLTEGNDASDKHIKSLRVGLAAHWYKQLGWDDKPDDDANTKQLRHTALSLTLAGEQPDAIKEALIRYKAAKEIQDLPAEIRNSILSAVVRNGTKKDIDNLLTAYQTVSPDVQLDITGALSSTKDPKTATYIFTKAIGSNGFVRTQDVLRWMALFLRNRYTRDVTWQFMIDEWEWLKASLNSSKSFDYLPTYCAGIVSTPEWAQKYRDFFGPLEAMKSLHRNILVGYSDIDARVAWRKRDESKISDWFVKNAV